jgi:hypothetical protein
VVACSRVFPHAGQALPPGVTGRILGNIVSTLRARGIEVDLP